MSKKIKTKFKFPKTQTDLNLARELSDLWDENEKSMGEQAAYSVSCDILGISTDEGYELLALLNSKEA